MIEKKVALITGGGSGIGLATARALLEQQFTVILADASIKNLAQAEKELSHPDRVFTMELDVRHFPEVHDKISEKLKSVGKIDVLVNNAGISMPRTVVEMREEDWDRTMDVNLKGAFNCCHALLPGMLSQKSGKIINVSSISAKSGGGHGTVSKACYAASKAGLLGFTRGLAREAAPYVLVNAVCPGIIETPMTSNLTGNTPEKLLDLIPLQRFGKPEDVAHMIAFLASPKSGYLTGEVIDINGGMYID